MSLEHAFDLWDWTTVLGLVVVGIVAGYALLPYAWPLRHDAGLPYPAVMAGFVATVLFATFFVFLIAFRYGSALDPVVVARTIGTGCEGVVFALSAGIGLHFRTAPARSTTNADLAGQLAELTRMTLAASESAEQAHVAASAADDRVISQAERAVDDRQRGIRIEDVATDTNHRAMDIQERLP